jgi:hypothetical protein
MLHPVDTLKKKVAAGENQYLEQDEHSMAAARRAEHSNLARLEAEEQSHSAALALAAAPRRQATHLPALLALLVQKYLTRQLTI